MDDYDWDGAPWYSQKDEIQTVVMEDGVTSIGDYAFLECASLTSVRIPENIMKLVMQTVNEDCVVVVDTLENLGGSF